MNPTLKDGDRLLVTPWSNNRVHIGDVIVFQEVDSRQSVVHRVLSIDPQGIITKGDNNQYPDPWIISPEAVIGRVVGVRRKNKWVKICGGLTGYIYSQVLGKLKIVHFTLLRTVRPAYYRLVKWGIVGKIFRSKIKYRLVSYRRPGGREIQLHIGHLLIARHRIGEARWHISPPFRLLIDEASLPKIS